MANRTNDFSKPIQVADGGTGAIDASNARANLGITIGARSVVGTVGQIDVSNSDGSLGNPTVSLASNTIIPGNGGLFAPNGVTLERPGMPALGCVRGNVDLNCLETWNGSYWQMFFPSVFGQLVTLSYTNLAGGAQIPLLTPPDSTTSYRISNILLSSNGVNFDGAGDRNLVITDGVTEWTIIPDTALKALSNQSWGSVAVPYPVSSGLDTYSVAGDVIYAAYDGGTTDYVDGNVRLIVEYQQVS